MIHRSGSLSFGKNVGFLSIVLVGSMFTTGCVGSRDSSLLSPFGSRDAPSPAHYSGAYPPPGEYGIASNPYVAHPGPTHYPNQPAAYTTSHPYASQPGQVPSPTQYATPYQLGPPAAGRYSPGQLSNWSNETGSTSSSLFSSRGRSSSPC